jgi:hypothetical protein
MDKWQQPLQKVTIVIYFISLLLLLFAPIKTPFFIYDEGFAVFNATQILNGKIPYRDFWSVYPPAQSYTLAAIFKIFGSSLLAARIYDTLVRFIIVLGIFQAAKKMSSRSLAWIASLMSALLLGLVGFYAYAVYPALAWSVWALWSALKYSVTGQRHWLILAGILAGAGGFYRWDIGLYTVVSLSGVVFFYQFFRINSGRSTRWKAGRTGLKYAASILAGCGASSLVLYGLVSLQSGLRAMWEQVVLFPTTHLLDVRWLRYPALYSPDLLSLSAYGDFYSRQNRWLHFFLPLAIFTVAWLYYAYALIKKRISLGPIHFGTMAAALLGSLLFVQALSRYDFIHVLPSLLAAALVAVGLASQAFRPQASRVLQISLVVLLPGIIVVYFVSVFSMYSRNLDSFPPDGCYSRLKRASCVYTDENQLQAVAYVRAHTREGEAIYVGNLRHDCVFFNDVGFYFLADRPSATRYSTLHPGMVTTLPVQQEIVNELETAQVALMVLVNIGNSGEPNRSSLSSGIVFLDDYIRVHYLRIAQFGEYQVWERVSR